MEKENKKSSHVVTLRKFMTADIGRSEKEIKEYHLDLIEQQRKKRREEMLKERRTPRSKNAPQMVFKIQEDEIKEIKQEETKQEMPNGITVIDLEALVSGGIHEI